MDLCLCVKNEKHCDEKQTWFTKTCELLGHRPSNLPPPAKQDKEGDVIPSISVARDLEDFIY